MVGNGKKIECLIGAWMLVVGLSLSSAVVALDKSELEAKNVDTSRAVIINGVHHISNSNEVYNKVITTCGKKPVAEAPKLNSFGSLAVCQNGMAISGVNAVSDFTEIPSETTTEEVCQTYGCN